MITGTARVDMSRDSREADRRAIGSLYGVPNGTRVILHVGERTTVAGDLDLIREYVDRVHIDVQGAPHAVASWLDALHCRGVWADW